MQTEAQTKGLMPSWPGVRPFSGFTLIELMVSIAVLAVILAIAVPSFSKQIQSGRTEAAAQGLARAVASARATASQTGRRTTLLVNGSAKCGSDSSVAVAWRIAQGDDVLSCLSKTDFSSRYEGTVFVNEAASTGSITFLPTGIATNTNALSFGFVSGSTTKTVTINSGGTANVL